MSFGTDDFAVPAITDPFADHGDNDAPPAQTWDDDFLDGLEDAYNAAPEKDEAILPPGKHICFVYSFRGGRIDKPESKKHGWGYVSVKWRCLNPGPCYGKMHEQFETFHKKDEKSMTRIKQLMEGLGGTEKGGGMMEIVRPNNLHAWEPYHDTVCELRVTHRPGNQGGTFVNTYINGPSSWEIPAELQPAG